MAADVLYSDKKQNHIAAAMRLPEVSGRRHPMGPGEACFPPLLVVNIQLPSYAVRLSPPPNTPTPRTQTSLLFS